jgi:tetratricopeptide (TPR) repeat protein
MKHYQFSRYILVFLLGCLIIAWTGCAKEEVGKIPVTTSSLDALRDFKKGRDLFEKLQGQESLEYFQKAISKDPDFALAYLYNSFSQPTVKGFWDQLDKAFALKEKVSEGEQLWIDAVKAGAEGFPIKQQDLYQKQVTAYPNDERAHANLGNSYFVTQEYEKAIEQYKECNSINSDFSQAYNQMGYAYRFLEKYDESEKAFKKYIELIPDDPNPYDSYAELLMKMGRYDESIVQYKKALEVNPNFVASHIGIATNLNFKREYEEARKRLTKLFEMARDAGEKRAARFATTVSFVAEGKMDEAIEELKWQYSLGKNNNDAPNMAGDLISMGNIYIEVGDYDQALEKFEKALKVMEESDLSQEVKENAKRNFLFNSGRVALMKKDLKKAKADADEYLKQAQTANNTFQIWGAHQLAGMIAMYGKNYGIAIDELKQANLQNPYNLYRLALAYAGAGQKAQAKEYCEKAAKHNTLNSLQYAFMRQKAHDMLATM